MEEVAVSVAISAKFELLKLGPSRDCASRIVVLLLVKVELLNTKHNQYSIPPSSLSNKSGDNPQKALFHGVF